MTDLEHRPEPGSLWAKHCPDAFPREWMDHTRTIPAGFRPADRNEADLITGRATENVYLERAGKMVLPEKPKPVTPPAVRCDAQKPKPTDADKLTSGLKQIFRSLARRRRAGQRKLRPLAVVLLVWLWYCGHARRGRAKTSLRKLAVRFTIGNKDTVAVHLDDLERAGFLAVVRRGKHNRSATVYRVRPTPKTPTNTVGTETTTGLKNGPLTGPENGP